MGRTTGLALCVRVLLAGRGGPDGARAAAAVGPSDGPLEASAFPTPRGSLQLGAARSAASEPVCTRTQA